VEANKECIALFHLPSYSPEHNPDEYLNGDLKSELGRKVPPMNQQHLEKNLIGSMREPVRKFVFGSKTERTEK
jgi:hypothetical protein